MNQERIAAVAQMYPTEMDIEKRLSYGVQRSATNMIDERPKADEIAFEIQNKTNSSQFLVISSLFEDENNKTIFDNVRDMLNNCAPGIATDRVHAFQNGEIWKSGAQELIVQSKSSNFVINRFLRYVGMCPTRVTKARFKSVTVAGAADTGNYDNRISSIFFSPFAQPKEEFLSLAPLVQSGINFNANILDVDFIDQAFPVILSNEHFLVVEVNANTILTVNMFIGAQDSPAQRHWRFMRRADDIIRQNGIGK